MFYPFKQLCRHWLFVCTLRPPIKASDILHSLLLQDILVKIFDPC